MRSVIHVLPVASSQSVSHYIVHVPVSVAEFLYWCDRLEVRAAGLRPTRFERKETKRECAHKQDVRTGTTTRIAWRLEWAWALLISDDEQRDGQKSIIIAI